MTWNSLNVLNQQRSILLLNEFAERLTRLALCNNKSLGQRARLFPQPTQQSMNHRLAVFFIDGFGQWDVHRTGLDAVLGVAAVGDAVVPHDALEPLIAIHRTARMHVE